MAYWNRKVRIFYSQKKLAKQKKKLAKKKKKTE